MKRFLITTLCFSILLSCQPDTKEQRANKADHHQERLIGEWENISIKVTVHNNDGDSIIDVPADRWEEMLQIKPIRTTFDKDSTFISEYRSLEDSVIMTTTGVWYMKGDSLTMVERGSANHYMTKIHNDTVEFEGYLDWDQDGEADDHYYGLQKKR